MPALTVGTPAGKLLLVERGGVLAEARFLATGETAIARQDNGSDLLHRAKSQIDAYFRGERHGFDLPLAAAATPFQDKVRRAMLSIPYGQTRGYGELAHAAGGGPRAIGQACGANPLPVIVPCHRVVGANGLGGYSGGAGLATKRLLLDLERGDTG